MKKSPLFLGLCILLLGTACNNKEIKRLETEVADKAEQIKKLEQEIEYLKSTNSSQLELMSDLSVISKKGAESIQNSLENITQQYGFIQDLTKKVQSKDSLNLALVMNLKRSLSDINDQDIQVEVRGGVVYVSISDQLLFSSGSSKLSNRAKEVLGKVASVINDHNDMNVMVEGHTDDIPIANSCVSDNWDLSVRRATSVVRMLQNEYYVSPERITAAGRAEYQPIRDNDDASGRSANRRTEIIITPQLDQFFKLLESPILAD